VNRSIVTAIPHFEAMAPIARAAEAAGYHRVWTTESMDRDAVVRAVSIGCATSTIGVATGIAYAFTRHPLAAAAQVADASAATGGRFLFGIGAGTRGQRRRYAAPWEHPAPQFVEYVEAVRALLTGEPVHYDGTYYQIDMPAGLGRAAVPVEIYGSGVNKIMLRECASVCDGVGIHSLAAAPGYLEAITLPAITAGSERNARKPTIACWYIACVDEDEEVARQGAKLQLAFYLSTPSYRTVAEFGGWGDVAARIRELAKETGYQDWHRVAREVPDHVVDDLTLAGTAAQVRSRLPGLEARLAAAGVEELVFQLVGTDSTAEEVEAAGLQLVSACAPK
jgi:alkanesulfonate monooxygenase SsuD/methylene tetrahydromethanopterin reductase-like flavin-dependent oxidoreductase (luciferase family)